jgi:hypothetical protein
VGVGLGPELDLAPARIRLRYRLRSL